MPATRPFVDIRALTKIYGEGVGAVQALRGINLSLTQGEVMVLLGPSGSGKSTLLNILGGLDQASSGEVWVGAQNICTLSADALTLYRRQHIGFIFQFYNLIPSLSAQENIEVVADLCADSLSPTEVLARVGLSGRAHHFPAELSGGEQQRVAIARALVKRPTLILCDEPTGALDLKTGIVTLEALLTANQHFGATLLIVTHNADLARIAHRVVHFADGHILSVADNPSPVAPSDLQW